MAENDPTAPGKPERADSPQGDSRADLSDLSTPERHAISHLFTAMHEAILTEIDPKDGASLRSHLAALCDRAASVIYRGYSTRPIVKMTGELDRFMEYLSR
jgi:hypothetical protein